MIKTICGTQLSGSEAIFVILKGDKENYEVIDTGMPKIVLDEYSKQSAVQHFRQTVKDFLNNEEVDKVIIKARSIRGKFSGGSVSFIIEGIIQTLDIPVEVIHATTISKYFKNNPVDLDQYNIFKYQHDSFKTAYYGLDD